MAGNSIRRAFDVQQKSGSRWETRVPALIGWVTVLRGGEEVMVGRLSGWTTVAIRFRASPLRDLNTAWRLKDSQTGAVFDVQSVAPDGRSHVNLTCRTKGA